MTIRNSGQLYFTFLIYSILLHQMTLYVKPISALLTRDTETFSNMDPFVIVTVGSETQKTKTHKQGGKKPHWDEVLIFKSNANKMVIKVMDKDPLSDDEIGVGAVELKKYMDDPIEHKQYIPLTFKGKNAGKIYMSIKYMGNQAINPNSNWGTNNNTAGNTGGGTFMGGNTGGNSSNNNSGWNNQQPNSGWNNQQQNSGWNNQPQPNNSGWNNQQQNSGWNNQQQPNNGWNNQPQPNNSGWNNQQQNSGWNQPPPNSGWGPMPTNNSQWNQHNPSQNWGVPQNNPSNQNPSDMFSQLAGNLAKQANNNGTGQGQQNSGWGQQNKGPQNQNSQGGNGW